MGNAKWWVALAGAALLLMLAAGYTALKQRDQQGTGTAVAPVTTAGPADAGPAPATGGCSAPEQVSLPGTDQDSAPVVLWAVSPVRLFIDGKAAFSPPDSPLRFSGEHTLRAEAPGQTALVSRFRVEPNVPALFHAQVDDGIGITLVRLGVRCVSCEFPQVDVVLDYLKSDEPSFSLIQAAALSLRTDQWVPALARLRRVPKEDRKKPVYLRLASNLYQSAQRPTDALGAAKAIPKDRSNDLTMLLGELEKLRLAEVKSKGEVLLTRWNQVTERFGVLAGKFSGAAPGPISASTRRLEQLSNAFTSQLEAKDERAERGTVEAAEQTLLQLVKEIRATKPEDCDFQLSVVNAVTGQGGK